MSSLQEIQQAIRALEAQRAALGDEVTETAVTILREKLAIHEERPAVAQHEQLTVLVADLSGFTALSEWRDAEEVRDTMNAVWQKLDSVIESWGGKIDKHVGDGVIALFGAPAARPDDAERAVQAALDMHLELALFNNRAVPELSEAGVHWTLLPAQLRMRIAIHAGPVLFGKVGTSDEVTAVGDAVNLANQLERLAPIGGILISEAVHRQVHALFDVQSLEVETDREVPLLDGAHESGPFYVVMRSRPGAFRSATRNVEAGAKSAAVLSSDTISSTRLVGRTEELQQLQESLQTTVDSGLAQVVTITGEAGIGKSRLLVEFENLVALLPERVCLFKGWGQGFIGHLAFDSQPYALWRDVFINYFNIHPRYSAAFAREKLVRGLIDVMTNSALHEEASRARERAHFIGHLLGFNFADSPYLQGIQNEARRIREYGFQDIAHFFKAVAASYQAVVLFLEDIHLADEGSFDLLEYLVQENRHLPLLIVCLARPTLFEKRPSWPLAVEVRKVEGVRELPLPVAYQHLKLSPLSAIDSRHLVADILHRIPDVPLRLGDLLIDGADGNPFHVEELVRILIEEGVIIKSSERWRVDMVKLAEFTTPLTLAALVQARLRRLPPAEQAVLEKAATAGPVFWDTLLLPLAPVIHTTDSESTPALLEGSLPGTGREYWVQQSSSEGEELSLLQLKEILRRLEEKSWIYQRVPVTSLHSMQALNAGRQSALNLRREEGEEEHAALTGAREYAFRHDRLRDLIYNMIPSGRRQHYHRQIAAWFVAHYSQAAFNPAGYAGVIAFHLEQAGEDVQATAWYARAARQAEIGYAPETAIRYYRRALTLLPAKASVGFGGAAEPISNPREASPELAPESIGDSKESTTAQRVALNEGLGEMLRWRARFSDAIKPFKAMQVAARGIEDYAAEVRAHLGLFWAYTGLGKSSAALASASQAESVARAALSHHSLATTLAAKGWALLSLGDISAAIQAGKEALTLSSAAVAPREIAYSNLLLGNIGRVSGYFDRAVQHTEKALHLFRQLGDRFWEGFSLAQLGRIDWSRGQDDGAIVRYHQSLRIARDIGDYYGTMLSLRQLGRLAQHQDDYAQAEELLQQALIFAEKSDNNEVRIALANDLGELYLAQALAVQNVVDAMKEDHLHQAYVWFKHAWQLAQETDRPLRQAVALTGLARLHLEAKQPNEARDHARNAIAQARRALQTQPSLAGRKVLVTAQRIAVLVNDYNE